MGIVCACVCLCVRALFLTSPSKLFYIFRLLFFGVLSNPLPMHAIPGPCMGRAGMKIGNKINYLVCALFRIGVLGLTAYFLPFCFSLTEASARCEGVVALRVDRRVCVCVFGRWKMIVTCTHCVTAYSEVDYQFRAWLHANGAAYDVSRVCLEGAMGPFLLHFSGSDGSKVIN